MACPFCGTMRGAILSVFELFVFVNSKITLATKEDG